jgi:hypothetical protein
MITHLSFTRLKNLAHSPLALKRYIESDFKATKAMDEGTLLDCLLFTPDAFGDTFYLMPDDVKKPTSAQLNAKKPSDESIAQIARWQQVEAEIGGRIVVKQEDVDAAKQLAEQIRDNSTVAFHGLMNPDFFEFQHPVEFWYKGFKHRGIADAWGHDRSGNLTIWDLKRMGARSGEHLVRGQIRNNMYDLQAAIYCHEHDIADIHVNYYIIAVDNDGYVTPFQISRDARDQARKTWDRLIKAAHRCNMEGLDAGCEFYADTQGFFQF